MLSQQNNFISFISQENIMIRKLKRNHDYQKYCNVVYRNITLPLLNIEHSAPTHVVHQAENCIKISRL